MSETLLDTQNEVKLIKAQVANPSGRVSVKLTGNFSAGDVEIGHKNEAGTFTVYDAGTISAAGDVELPTGPIDVWARATGATPAVITNTDSVF